MLTAVDAAVMVIDAGKGIETQTRKLFEVCRLRGVPIFTFMNKMDRPLASAPGTARRTGIGPGHSRDSPELAAGRRAGISRVYDRENQQVHLFERTAQGAFRAPVAVSNIQDERR